MIFTESDRRHHRWRSATDDTTPPPHNPRTRTKNETTVHPRKDGTTPDKDNARKLPRSWTQCMAKYFLISSPAYLTKRKRTPTPTPTPTHGTQHEERQEKQD